MSEELRKAAQRVLDGLNARIEAAPGNAVPVFDGIAELRAALRLKPVEAKAEAGAPADALREALVKIASGMGRDIEGTTSLSREDMQDIAQTALRSGAKEET